MIQTATWTKLSFDEHPMSRKFWLELINNDIVYILGLYMFRNFQDSYQIICLLDFDKNNFTSNWTLIQRKLYKVLKSYMYQDVAKISYSINALDFLRKITDPYLAVNFFMIVILNGTLYTGWQLPRHTNNYLQFLICTHKHISYEIFLCVALKMKFVGRS